MNKNLILISVACISKESRGKVRWLIGKPTKDSEWELPRIASRKAESTARGAIRMGEEQLGVVAQVIEEAGRAGGITKVNNKTVPQRHLYYFMIYLEASEQPVVFHEIAWLEYGKAVRKLVQKRDKQMLKAATGEFRSWKKRIKDDPPPVKK